MIVITSVYWLLLTVTLIWWGVPRQMEIEATGNMGPDLLFLCYKTGSALCLISQCCAGQTLLCGFLCGQSWSDLAADAACREAGDTCSMSCVLTLDCFAQSSIVGKLGQLQFSHFLVHKQKGVLLHSEEGAGDM